MLFPKKVESINTSVSIPQYCSINYLSILPSLQSVLQYCQPSDCNLPQTACFVGCAVPHKEEKAKSTFCWLIVSELHCMHVHGVWTMASGL